jgi:hypothetical protein
VTAQPAYRESDVVGPGVRFCLSLLPVPYADVLAGDLIEEATMFVAPSSGQTAARRWLRRQLFKSVPALVSLHFRQKENDEMKNAKWIAALALVVIGALQAWDSGVLDAPLWIGVMVAAAIAMGVAGLFLEHEGIRFGIGVVVILILFTARMVSPVRLPELSLIGFPIFLMLIFAPRFIAMSRQKNGTKGPGAAA